MEEIWKPIANHPLYYVSNTGKIKRKDGNERVKCIDTHGYLHVRISENGKESDIRVHREVAKAFIPRMEGKEYVNHIDGDKTNNNIENLEWCTCSENNYHRVHVLNKWPQNIKQIQHWRSVRCVETGEVYDNCAVAAASVSGDKNNIWRCCRGERRTHMGLHWEYTD